MNTFGKFLLLSAIAGLLAGCGGVKNDEETVVKINDYRMTKNEFETAYQESSFSRGQDPASKTDFLNNLVNRQLILQAAQSQGLDRTDDFIAAIQKFWEQSLLKTALERKSRQISQVVNVDDSAVEEAYNKMLAEGRTDKTCTQMYQQIKWELRQAAESQLMDKWLQQLRKDSVITIKEDLINCGVKDVR